MSETLFSRKENNLTVGGIKAKIPTNVLALSLLAHNPVSDNEEFREDGYVYKGKKRIRKWFSSFGNWKHFWSPVLNQIERLENIYHKLDVRSKKQWDKCCELMREIIASGKTGDIYGCSGKLRSIAHCWDGKNWRVVEVDDDPANYGLSLSVNFLDKKPKRVVNRKLGQETFKYYSSRLFSSVNAAVAELLERAIIQKLDSNEFTRKDDGHVFDVLINNRKYVYVLRFDRGMSFQKVAWPGEKYSSIRF